MLRTVMNKPELCGKVQTVDYWWLDEYVDKIILNPDNTLTVQWKAEASDNDEPSVGVTMTIPLDIKGDWDDPIKLAQKA